MRWKQRGFMFNSSPGLCLSGSVLLGTGGTQGHSRPPEWCPIQFSLLPDFLGSSRSVEHQTLGAANPHKNPWEEELEGLGHLGFSLVLGGEF